MNIVKGFRFTFFPRYDKNIVIVQDGEKRWARTGVRLADKHAVVHFFTWAGHL